MSLAKIDKRRGLLPWSVESHKNHVLAEYGSMKATHPEDAKMYIEEYLNKEEEFDLHYQEQKTFFDGVNEQNKNRPNYIPQNYPEPEKIDWIPEDFELRKATKEAAKKKPKKDISVEEFQELKAPQQKKLLKKLNVDGDDSTEEERVVLYQDYLSK